MRLSEVVAASRAVGGTSGRLDKVGHLADLLRRVPPEEIETVIGFLSGAPRQGRMGIGGATLAGLRAVPAADSALLDIRAVDAALDPVAPSSPAGSASRRAETPLHPLGRALPAEPDF